MKVRLLFIFCIALLISTCIGASSTPLEDNTSSPKATTCEPNPCRNGGLCTESSGNVSCNCTKDGHTLYDGKMCENAILPCDLTGIDKKCTGENEICATHPSRKYTCLCKRGFIIKSKKCIEDPCTKTPCENNGRCSTLSSGDYFCNCTSEGEPTYYEGKNCDKEIDGCRLTGDAYPCKKANQHCNGTGQDFHCVCNKGFKMNTTSQECYESPCDPNPCENGGFCTLTGTTEKFSCNCTVDGHRLYDGNTCNIEIAKCKLTGIDKVCKGENITCNGKGKVFNCSCDAGFLLNNKSNMCSPDPCASASCKHGTTCVAVDGKPSCNCTVNGSTLYSGKLCEKEIPKCNLSGAAAVCKGEHNQCIGAGSKFNCSCDAGYLLNKSTNTCFKNPCEHTPCQNNGTCVPQKEGDFTCKCTVKGHTLWEGKTCGKAIEKCKLTGVDEICKGPFNHCNGTGLNATCYCDDGFKLNITSNTCYDFDDCVDKDICKDPKYAEGSVCSNIPPGSFTCDCKKGYHAVGANKTANKSGICEDINECVPGNKLCKNGECKNDIGTYHCDCNSGYEPSGDKKSCLNINECERYNNTQNCGDSEWPIGSVCVDKLGTYDCECETGFHVVGANQTLNTSGECQDIIECDDKDICNNATLWPKGSECKNKIGSYDCHCNASQTIDFVTKENPKGICSENKCKPNPCRNNGTCSQSNGNLTCNCSVNGQTYYQGHLCQIDIDECKTTSHDCDKHNNTRCNNTLNGFECICKNGYTRNVNGTCADINECTDPSFQGDNKKCKGQHNKCENMEGGYTCHCSRGYQLNTTNETCFDINECEYNGTKAKCIGEHNHCENLIGDFRCYCDAGYNLNETTKACDDVDECLNTSSCFHGSCTNRIGGFNCSCDGGYKPNKDKTECLNVNECKKNTTICNDPKYPKGSVCTDTDGSYSCACGDGFDTVDHNATSRGFCKDQNECKNTSLCANGNCTNTPGSYVCYCFHGYEPSDDKHSCININECERYNNTQNCGDDEWPIGSVCVDKLGTYDCECKTGYHVVGANQTLKISGECQDINECLDKDKDPCKNAPVGSICHNLIGSHKCSCNDSLVVDFINSTTTPYGVCSEDVCASNPCAHGGTCSQLNGQAICNCSINGVAHYEGKFCENDIDECTKMMDDCDHYNNTKCENNNGGYDCICKTGYQHKNGSTERYCVDTNECDENKALCAHGECQNLVGDYTCKCNSGYQLASDGKHCEDINECELNKTDCKDETKWPQPNVCRNTQGSFECICAYGYHPEGRNKTIGGVCKDTDECAEDPDICKNTDLYPIGSICHNRNGSFDCVCPSPLVLDFETTIGFKGACTENLCTGSPCHNGGKCHQLNGNFTCNCTVNGNTYYEGWLCDQDVNECSERKDNCNKYEHKECKNRNNGFDCVCKQNFKLNGTSCQDIDECKMTGDDKKCKGEFNNCTNLVGSYKCACKSGHNLNVTDQLCYDIDECKANSSLCEHGTCNNTAGGYHCDCKPGYETSADLKSCKNINECKDKTICGNNGVCIDTDGSFECKCINGYKGKTCNKDLNECEEAKNLKKRICPLNSICQNLQPNDTRGGYQCVCFSGFTKKTVNNTDFCDIELLPFGTHESLISATSGGDDVIFGPKTLKLDFPYYNKFFRSLYISTNGYVSFGTSFNKPNNPGSWDGATILSLFWTDLEIPTDKKNGGLYFAQELSVDYEKGIENAGKPIIKYISAFLKDQPLFTDKNFKPIYAAVLTWNNAKPFQPKKHPNMNLDAQMFLLSDGLVSYAVNIYKSYFGKFPYEDTSKISYAYSGPKNTPSLPEKLELDKGDRYRIFKLSEKTASPGSYRCIYYLHRSQLHPATKPCPCWKQQAGNDLMFSSTNGSCFQSLFPDTNKVKQVCCYDRFGELIENSKAAGHPALAVTAPLENDTYTYLHDNCCQGDNVVCAQFYKKFPSSGCQNYKAPGFANSFGDPHITTLDAFQYSYNGLGDFVLYQCGGVKLQGRTNKILKNDKAGKTVETGTTQIVAIAFKPISDKDAAISVHLEKGKLRTEWVGSKNKSIPQALKNQVIVIKTEKMVKIVAMNGFAIESTVDDLLAKINVPISSGASCLGLLGSLDKNYKNDLKKKDGEVVPMEDLDFAKLTQFGKSWQVKTAKDSIFREEPKTFDTIKQPDLGTSVKEVEKMLAKRNILNDKVKEVCGDSLFCYQDYLVNEDLDQAKSVKADSDKILERQKLQGIKYFKFTNENELWVGKNTFTMELKVEPDIPVTMTLSGAPTAGLTLDGKKLEWDTELFLNKTKEGNTLSSGFAVIAKSGEVNKVYRPVVKLCLCQNEAQCVDSPFSSQSSDNIHILPCKCDKKEFNGQFCDEPADFCTDVCVGEHKTCNSTAESCTCDEYYSLVEGTDKCAEATSCSTNNGLCPKGSTCHYSPDEGQTCECDEFFIRNEDQECVDIDECKQPDICKKPKHCVNTIGGYNCRCSGDGLGKNCIKGKYIYNEVLGIEPVPFKAVNLEVVKKIENKISQLLNKESDYYVIVSVESISPDKEFITLNTLITIYSGSKLTDAKLNEINKKIMALKDQNCISHKCPLNLNLDDDSLFNVQFFLNGSPVSRKIDLCRLNDDAKCDPLTTTCSSDNTTRTCTCKSGFEQVLGDDSRCQDINECTTKSKPCADVEDSCRNSFGSYECDCNSKQRWNRDLQVCEDHPCTNNPCQHDGVCLLTNNTFSCRCKEDYHGDTCQHEEEESDKLRVAVICVSVILGIATLFLLIVLVVTCLRHKRTLETDNYSAPGSSRYDYSVPRPKVRADESSENGKSHGVYDDPSSIKDNESRYTGLDLKGRTYENRAYDNREELSARL